MELLSGYNKSEIARIYYQEVYPERNYNKDAARKQFAQDKNINMKILKRVLKNLLADQLKEIK